METSQNMEANQLEVLYNILQAFRQATGYVVQNPCDKCGYEMIVDTHGGKSTVLCECVMKPSYYISSSSDEEGDESSDEEDDKPNDEPRKTMNSIIKFLDEQPKDYEQFYQEMGFEGDRFKREGYWFSMLNDTPYSLGERCFASYPDWNSYDDLVKAREQAPKPKALSGDALKVAKTMATHEEPELLCKGGCGCSSLYRFRDISRGYCDNCRPCECGRHECDVEGGTCSWMCEQYEKYQRPNPKEDKDMSFEEILEKYDWDKVEAFWDNEENSRKWVQHIITTNAALTIQKVFRGFRVRKTTQKPCISGDALKVAKTMATHEEPEPSSSDEEVPSSIDTDSDEEESEELSQSDVNKAIRFCSGDRRVEMIPKTRAVEFVHNAFKVMRQATVVQNPCEKCGSERIVEKSIVLCECVIRAVAFKQP